MNRGSSSRSQRHSSRPDCQPGSSSGCDSGGGSSCRRHTRWDSGGGSDTVRRIRRRPPLPQPAWLALLLALCMLAASPRLAAAAACHGLAVSQYNCANNGCNTIDTLATNTKGPPAALATYAWPDVNIGIINPVNSVYAWAPKQTSSFSMIMTGYLQVSNPARLLPVGMMCAPHVPSHSLGAMLSCIRQLRCSLVSGAVL